MSLSDHIHVLSYGKIIAEGSPQQVVNNQAVVEAYLGRGSTAESDSLAGGAHA
jgi:ABC-type branched-subunit amino acid transport system ATPase component